MLLRFSVTNHASLRDEQELSLIADKSRPERAEGEVPRSRHRVVPAAAIYGANASGKSNVIDAIAWMGYAVTHSFSGWQPSGGVPRRSFAFDTDREERPTSFEIEFVLSETHYRYGFSCDDERILSEWLYSYPQGRQRRLFIRHADMSISFGRGLSGRRQVIAELLRPNSLYLSVAAAQGHELLKDMHYWFSHSLLIATDSDFAARLDDMIERYLLGPHRRHEDVLQLLLRFADTGVHRLEVAESSPDSELERELERMRNLLDEAFDGKITVQDSHAHRVRAVHKTEQGEFRLSLAEESSGTRTWIGMVGPIYRALAEGATLCVDELDARLHPELSNLLIGLFQSPTVNVHHAQLVFSTHETSLLSKNSTTRLFRDQVWLTSKDHQTGSTMLFPLTDFQERDTDNMERHYLLGRFGALPFIRDGIAEKLAAEFRQHRRLSEPPQKPQTPAPSPSALPAIPDLL